MLILKTFMILLFLSLNCYAGRVSYGLHTLGMTANDEEVDYSKRSTCKNVGTRLIVTYENQNQHNQYELLWNAEVTFKPEALLHTGARIASRVNAESSAVVLRYKIYGNDNPDQQKQAYEAYYGLVNADFTSSNNGNFQHKRMRPGVDISQNLDNTALITFEFDDDPRNVSIDYLKNTIENFRVNGDFPLYSGKGFRFRGNEEILNCITFHVRLLQSLNIPVTNNQFINDYLNSRGWKKIAYPEIFFAPLIEVCMEHGGSVNVGNISSSYNGFYYQHYKPNNLRTLLEDFPDNAPRRGNNEIQKDNMWVVGRPARDNYHFISDNPIPDAIGVAGGIIGGGIVWGVGVASAATIGAFTTTIAAPVVGGGALLFFGAHGIRKVFYNYF